MCMKIELEFGVLVFVEGGKPESPEKNPRSRNENQQQTHIVQTSLHFRHGENAQPALKAMVSSTSRITGS